MHYKILIPCYNDWIALDALIARISETADATLLNSISFLIVNDGSTIACPTSFSNTSLEVLHLNRNVGHQRAIAIGLSYIFFEAPCDCLIVMDADGEDKPEDIPLLINSLSENKDKIIFAERAKRSEGFIFRFFYRIYKSIFRILTGKKIYFGNFCIIPFHLLKNIVFVSEIWNHFSGGIIRSKIPYRSIPLHRGKRLAGQSTMNFTSLIIHGMSAVSVHIDVVAVRLLLFSLGLIVFAVLGIVTVAAIRLFTPFAIPGWASYLVLAFAILFFQAFLISLFLVFVVLTYRTQKHFIPALDYKDFIAGKETFAFKKNS